MLANRMPETLAAVDDLLGRRAAARAVGDFQSADALRNELRQRHGVYVDDNAKQWNAADPRFASNGQFNDARNDQRGGGGPRVKLELRGVDYRRTAGDDAPLTLLSEDDIVELLDRRCLARTRGDYATADAIKAELSNEFGVEVRTARGSGATATRTGGRASRAPLCAKGHDHTRPRPVGGPRGARRRHDDEKKKGEAGAAGAAGDGNGREGR